MGDTTACFATINIAAGEEITICYHPDFECRTRHDRHQLLRFGCECEVCLMGTPLQQLSDMRRTLVRGLQYLTLGVDLDGQRQSSASTIITDSKLKKAAEEFSIPLSARLIYNILSVVLLEEEGLLDDFMVERITPGIVRMATLFKTETNARIAKFAIAQETWLDRLCIAFSLYGQEDEADHEFAVRAQMLKG